MSTLIAAYNSQGCIGRCDARCYNARDPKCTCICGGRNHGIGRARAVQGTPEWIDELLNQLDAHNRDDPHYQAIILPEPPPPEPLPLWPNWDPSKET